MHVGLFCSVGLCRHYFFFFHIYQASCICVILLLLLLLLVVSGATAPEGQGILIDEVSRSHTTTHHSR